MLRTLKSLNGAALSLVVAAFLTCACTQQTTTAVSPAVLSDEAARDAVTAELPDTATAILLTKGESGTQKCTIRYSDHATLSSEFSPDFSAGGAFDLYAVHGDYGVQIKRHNGSLAKALQAAIRYCVQNGVVSDKYHSSPI